MNEFNKPRLALFTGATVGVFILVKVASVHIAKDFDKKVVEEKAKVQLEKKAARIKNQKQVAQKEIVRKRQQKTLAGKSGFSASKTTETGVERGVASADESADFAPEGEVTSEGSKGVAAGGAMAGGMASGEGKKAQAKDEDSTADATKSSSKNKTAKKSKDAAQDANKTNTTANRTVSTSSNSPMSTGYRSATIVGGGNVKSATTVPSKTLSEPTNSSNVTTTTDNNSQAPVENVVVTTSKPSGSYLIQPHIALDSETADSIKYCIGTDVNAAQCCDPNITYSGSFQLASSDGSYCVSAKGYKLGAGAAVYNWNYVVDASMVSLNFTMPTRTVFQTQQLHEAMTVDSDEFGDTSLSFYQRASLTDPGPVACDALNYTSAADEMTTSLGGVLVNFGSVNAPFQIPLRIDNKLEYGINYLVSIVERTVVRAPATTDVEKVCLQNTIEVNDFHIEGVAASGNQLFPTDGTYTLQGGLTFINTFPVTGESQGANGIILEHGFINIIN